MIKSGTIRLILSFAVSLHWSIKLLDFNNVFINGDLQEQVIITRPQGYESSAFPHHACCLDKALYGLKQAPRAWFGKLKGVLLQQGFITYVVDSSIFVIQRDSSYIANLVYVDDAIITGRNVQDIQNMIISLCSILYQGSWSFKFLFGN